MDYRHIILHPATVHLPIGALMAAICFIGYGWYRRLSHIEQAGYYLVIFGWVTLIPSLITGTIDAVNRLADPNTPSNALTWINFHAASAIGVFVMVWLAWQRRRRITGVVWEHPRYRQFLGYMLVVALLVIFSGWSGGHMVYALQLGRLP
ncbi:MAG: DUF2231 domain-containing protein [Chloroflexia bacterium]|nr:DUF2231 domain-containing protein [Chloroflexia bacterium]